MLTKVMVILLEVGVAHREAIITQQTLFISKARTIRVTQTIKTAMMKMIEVAVSKGSQVDYRCAMQMVSLNASVS